jgi:hypothetical protein
MDLQPVERCSSSLYPESTSGRGTTHSATGDSDSTSQRSKASTTRQQHTANMFLGQTATHYKEDILAAMKLSEVWPDARPTTPFLTPLRVRRRLTPDVHVFCLQGIGKCGPSCSRFL